MGYKKASAFKMMPKSPMLKALKGNQDKLPQQLQAAIKAAPESPAKQTTAGEFAHKKSIKDKEMGKSTKAADKAKAAYDAMTTDKTYADAKKGYRKAAKKAFDAKSPAKLAGRPPIAPKAKSKYDKELNSLVASRKGLKKGTAEYNKVQNRINEKLGSSVRRREEKATIIAPKKKKATATPKVNTALPAKPSAPAASGKTAKPAKKNSPRVTQTANRATVVTKSNGVKKKETVNKNTGNKKVVVKDANTRTVTKTNKAGESTTKTTKRIGKGRIKGAIKEARLARLDKKATRQAAKAADKKSKGADKLSGLSDAKSPAKNYKKGYYGV